jgi:hypothetical protein
MHLRLTPRLAEERVPVRPFAREESYGETPWQHFGS